MELPKANAECNESTRLMVGSVGLRMLLTLRPPESRK